MSRPASPRCVLRSALTMAIVAGIAGVPGCGAKMPSTAAVTGVVTFAGAPLSGATVVFSTVEPVTGYGRLVATGQTGSDGRFSLATRVGSAHAAPGAAIGEHRVTVSAFGPPGEMTEEAYQAQLDAHQKLVETKGFLAAGDPPKPRVSRLKPDFSDAAKTPLRAKVAGGTTNEFTFAVE